MKRRTPQDLDRFDQKLERWAKAHPVLVWALALAIVLTGFGIAELLRRFL